MQTLDNATSVPSKKAFRLPKTVIPLSYEVEVRADPREGQSNLGFSGQVSIGLQIKEAVSEIVLHSQELTLVEARLQRQQQNDPLEMVFDKNHHSVSFRLLSGGPGSTIPEGSATLFVKFSGQLNPSMHGIYLATDGKDRAICTQCEATDARRIFPCFDEPEFKASLKWTIVAPKGLVALSNGELESVRDSGESQIFSYKETRRISSYLAALAIGDFEGSEETRVHGVPIRVYAPRGKLSQTRFAHGFTEKLLPYYEDYFGIPYGYGKYDQVAVPGFDAGAMENIGLVLFRQNLLLMDPASASWRQEKLVAKVIAHEFAHMWFGNWVTMRWWDDLWLNEAFAEWMAHKATHAVTPDYRVWDDFQDDKNRAMVDDALPTTHSIWTAVATPEEAIEMFDAITYQKGCAVMRMLENFLSEAPFRQGLRTYMRRYAEDNAAGPDLWACLTEASGQKVGEIMESWITQPGFPVLRSDLVQDDKGVRLVVSQRRFFSAPKDMAVDNPQLWQIPVVVRYVDDEGEKVQRIVLSERQAEEQLEVRGTLRFCYPNAGEVGFYRQHLSQGLWDLVMGNLASLAPVEIMGLLEDAWALVRNNTLPIEAFLSALPHFATITDHNVLRAVVDRLFSIDLLLKDSGVRQARLAFRSFVGELFHGQMEDLGYDPKPGEPQNDIQRRAFLISALANLARVPTSIERSVVRAEQELADPRSVDANLAGVFVGVAAKFGDEERYNSFVRTYVDRRNAGAPPQEVHRYLYSLATFRRSGLVSRTLSHMRDGTIPQEAVGSVLTQLLAQRHAQDETWGHLKDNWGNIRERIGDMGISRLIEALGHLRPLHREDVVAFFRENPPKGADRALARGLEAMEQREELRQRVTPGLLVFFSQKSQQGA